MFNDQSVNKYFARKRFPISTPSLIIRKNLNFQCHEQLRPFIPPEEDQINSCYEGGCPSGVKKIEQINSTKKLCQLFQEHIKISSPIFQNSN